MWRRYRHTGFHLIWLLLLVFLIRSLAASVELPNATYLSSFSEGLYAPIRIATDAQGNAYVTETRRHRVSVLDSSGNLVRMIYGIQSPLGIAVDNRGKLYVGDRETGSVTILNPDGSSAGKLGIGIGQFTMPADIAIDSQNKIYVVDSKEDCVKVFDQNGSYLSQFGDSKLVFPTGIAIDETNDAILVGQYGGLEDGKNAARIQIFDRNGNWKKSIGQYGSKPGEFTRIQGLAVDGKGRIYVTDCFQSTVQVVDYTGRSLAFIGNYGTGPGQLRLPSDVALDRYNRLWITSSDNGRVELFGIDEFSLPGGESSSDTEGSFGMELGVGVNFISVPLKPSTDWHLSDLAAHIGSGVVSILAYSSDEGKFVNYLPSFTDDVSANVPVTGSAAYIIVMSEAKTVKFQGTAWEREVDLPSGVSMFAVPRQPSGEWRLSDLVTHIGDGLIHLITYNRFRRQCEAYFPGVRSSLNTTVEGGVGYLAVMSQPKKVLFEGDAWRDRPLIPAAPIVDGPALSNIPVLVITGEALNLETGQTLEKISIEIKNSYTDVTQTVTTNSDGVYVAAFIDLVDNRAATVGDVLQMKATGPRWLSKTITYTLTAEDIQRNHIELPPMELEAMPRESVLLPSYPNPGNPETWIPFRLNADADVVVEIYNLSGQQIRTLALGQKSAGNYIDRQRAARWDGKNNAGESVTSGVYFYTLRAGTFEATRRIVILK